MREVAEKRRPVGRIGKSCGLRRVLLTIGVSVGLLGQTALAQDRGVFTPPSHLGARAELSDMGKTARAALNDDNCARKSTYVNRLWDIYQDGNHPFWARHNMAGDSPSLNVARRGHRDFIYREVEAINRLPCPRLAQVSPPPKVELQIGAGAGIVKLPRRGFLGFEVGGVPRTGVVIPDDQASGSALSGSLRFNDPEFLANLAVLDALGFHGFVDSYLDILFFYGDFDVDQSFGPIDPGAGTSLLIPGPRGGASGFSLGGNPANIVRDARYSADLAKGGVAIKIGQTARVAEGLSAGVTASVGYARIAFDERFSGSVPAFTPPRSFAYDSSVDVDQARLRLGTELVFRTRMVTDGGLEFGGEIKVSADVGPDFSRGSGDDRLSFTGFADSSIGIGKSSTDFGYSAGISAGLEFANGVKIGVEGRYIRENGLPVLVRDGTNPTRLELEGGDAFIGMGRLTIPFGTPVKAARR